MMRLMRYRSVRLRSYKDGSEIEMDFRCPVMIYVYGGRPSDRPRDRVSEIDELVVLVRGGSGVEAVLDGGELLLQLRDFVPTDVL